jgi:hypothetical protein
MNILVNYELAIISIKASCLLEISKTRLLLINVFGNKSNVCIESLKVINFERQK